MGLSRGKQPSAKMQAKVVYNKQTVVHPSLDPMQVRALDCPFFFPDSMSCKNRISREVTQQRLNNYRR